MTIDDKALRTLIAKEAIRELVLHYSRGVDRKDASLLRDLYTADAVDNHGNSFSGPASAYCDFLEQSFPYMRYSGHHACNHMISVDVDAGTGQGEVYAMAWHVIPDGQGGWLLDFMCVRYLDQYRLEADGRWRFARRDVIYDVQMQQPHDPKFDPGDLFNDVSYGLLTTRLFQKGARD